MGRQAVAQLCARNGATPRQAQRPHSRRRSRRSTTHTMTKSRPCRPRQHDHGPPRVRPALHVGDTSVPAAQQCPPAAGASCHIAVQAEGVRRVVAAGAAFAGTPPASSGLTDMSCLGRGCTGNSYKSPSSVDARCRAPGTRCHRCDRDEFRRTSGSSGGPSVRREKLPEPHDLAHHDHRGRAHRGDRRIRRGGVQRGFHH